jgi:predicted phage terminase large subunit-like protein
MSLMTGLSRADSNAIYEEALRRGDPATLRKLCKDDLFFLLSVACRRKDADNDFVYARCREFEQEPDSRLDLWAREHYKSTIITYAGTIQEVLRDPEITIGIFSHTRPIAKAFLFAIKTTFEENTFIKGLFKDVLYNDPQKESQKWSLDDGLIVRRKSTNPTCTLEAWGLVDGQPTSKHYNIRVYDDVVTLSSVTSPEMIEKTTNGWRISLNLGSESSGVSRERYIGTRYHANDTYKTIIDTGDVKVKEFYPTDLGKNDIDVVGNPVLMTTEALEAKRRKMGPYIYACQMLQNPQADKVMGFSTEWMMYYDCLKNNKNWNYYLLCDPAGEGKKKNKSKDPDYSVFIVIGMATDKNYYLVDMVRDRLSLTERTDKLFELIMEWNPKKIGYEQYGKDSDIAHIQYVQQQKGFRFEIEPLAGHMPKPDRIRRLVPVFENHRFYFPRRLPYITRQKQMVDMVQEFIAKEYIDFPVSSHDDMLDCMSRILDDNLGAVFPKMKEIRTDDAKSNPDGKYDVLVGNSPGSKII